ncbi:type II toxin-antitoxin system ParD family antitoxin [Stutzerimonas stutzeri]|uniref:type II toxin-antitoxin system ParD family antitoxin n=1 Tax=Stutzerimonas stutzeri TaxID=316 RepID=UPI0015E3F501|nr:type II toxin-antitoxin system ParD family antitoxin [Stutzerimonas stutzeri]MBA1265589.1 type II toxin-antitoxin system ParD family antitoxin [Stutzerimonas stutzeri]
MATHNVVLPAPLEQSVDNLVSSGRYQNRSEVIRAGLRLLLEREAMEAAKLEALRNAVASGLMQLETGDYDEVQPDELEDYLEQLGNSAGNH